LANKVAGAISCTIISGMIYVFFIVENINCLYVYFFTRMTINLIH